MSQATIESENSAIFTCFPYKNLKKKKQIWTCHKKGKGQSRVIIGIKKKLSHQYCIPSFKVIGNSWNDNLQMFLPYMGVTAILVMWPKLYEETFVPQTHEGSTCNWARSELLNRDNWLSSFRGAVIWKKLKILNQRHPGKIRINNLGLLWVSMTLTFLEVHSADCINLIIWAIS